MDWGAKTRAAVKWAGCTAIYTAAVVGGRHFTLYAAGGPPVAWPASGLLFAAFVLTKPRRWISITLAANTGLGVALIVAHLSLANLLVMTPVVCGSSAAGAWLIRTYGRRQGPRDRRDDLRALVFILVGGILVPAAIASLFTLYYASSAHSVPGRLYFTTWGQANLEFWRSRFAGSSLGILTITPFVVALATSKRRGARKPGPRGRLIDALILTAVAGVAAAVFGAPRLPHELRTPSILIPLLTLTSLRGSMTLTTLANMIAAWIMIVATIFGRGSFAMFFADPAGRTTALQMFIFVNVFSQTLFTAIIAGRARLITLLGGRGEELERLNEDLIRAKEVAVHADAAKSRVLAHVTHEIRTPLGAMIGFAELALNEDPPAEIRDHLEIIHRNGVRLIELVNRTLDLGKIEAGRFAIDAQAIDVRELTGEVLGLMRLKAHEKGLSLTVHFEGQPPVAFRSDPLRVRQILMNLIGNAIKFTAAGSVTLRVSAAGGPPARRLDFVIADTGVGITRDHAESLFQPWHQGDATVARVFGGTGLGLNLSRELARLLCGDVMLKSSGPGEGAVFAFTLPELPAPRRSVRRARAARANHPDAAPPPG